MSYLFVNTMTNVLQVVIVHAGEFENVLQVVMLYMPVCDPWYKRLKEVYAFNSFSTNHRDNRANLNCYNDSGF